MAKKGNMTGISAREVHKNEPATDDQLQAMISPSSAGKHGLSFDTLLTRAPQAYNQKTYARDSEAAAHGFFLLRDAGYYDRRSEIIKNDMAIGAALDMLVSLVIEREYTIEAADESDEATNIREAVQRDIVDNSDFDTFRRDALFYALAHGVCVHEMIWTFKDARVPGKMIHRHPGQFSWDEMWNMYFAFTFAEWQKDSLVPLHKFVVSRNPGPYNNPYGMSVIDALEPFVYFKHQMFKRWVEICELYGTPLLTAKLDREKMSESQWDKIEADLESMIEGLRSDAGCVLPPGVELVAQARMGNQTTIPHVALIEYIDREMIKYILGATLATEQAQFGTRALGDVHKGMIDTKAKPCSNIIAEAVRRDVFVPYVVRNMGEEYAHLAPHLVTDWDEGEDIDITTKVLDNAGKMGMQIPEGQAREWLGIRAPHDGEEVLTVNTGGMPSPALPFSEAKKENSPFAAFVDKEEIDEAHRNWRDVTNMTVNDLERWKEHPASRRASLSRAPIIRQLHLLTTPKKDWTGREVTSARRVYAFVQRMSNGEQGADISKRFPISKRDVSLLNWGHNPTGKTVATLIRELDKAANESRMADHADVIEFADGPTRREQYRRFLAILDGLSEEVATAAAIDIRQAMLDAVERIETEVGIDGITAATAAQYFDMPDLVQQMERTAAGGRALAMLRVVEASGNRLEGLPVQVAPEDFPPEFRDALDWMQTREIMNRDELREVTIALSKLAPGGRDAREIERAFRQEVLALARVPEPEVAALWQQELQRIVESGDTRVALLDFKDRLEDAAGSPIATDAYVNTVFRTETANAVAAQKRRVEEDPAVAGVIIGKRFFNPADGASRDSHEEMNGVVVAIGSAADEASKPGPPWSYNCRCDYEYIFAGEPLNETPDAEMRARRIRRFDQ